MTGQKRKRILNSHGKYDYHATKKRNSDPVAKTLWDRKSTVDKERTDYDRRKEKEEVETELDKWEQSQE
jgi:hypothetical protein